MAPVSFCSAHSAVSYAQTSVQRALGSQSGCLDEEAPRSASGGPQAPDANYRRILGCQRLQQRHRGRWVCRGPPRLSRNGGYRCIPGDFSAPMLSRAVGSAKFSAAAAAATRVLPPLPCLLCPALPLWQAFFRPAHVVIARSIYGQRSASRRLYGVPLCPVPCLHRSQRPCCAACAERAARLAAAPAGWL